MNSAGGKPIAFRIITIGGCILLLVAVIFILAENKIDPNARSMSPRDWCLQNLLQINAAADEFALEHKLTNGSPINFPNDLTPYIKLNSAGSIPPCPQGGTYHITKVGETPTCSLGTTVTPAHVLQ